MMSRKSTISKLKVISILDPSKFKALNIFCESLTFWGHYSSFYNPIYFKSLVLANLSNI